MASRAASNTIMKTKSEDIQCSLKSVGYKVVAQIATTLQGSIWRAYNSANKPVVIKVANKYLHKQGLAIVNGKPVKVKENILHEAGIMKYLMDTGDCPASIVRFIDFIETYALSILYSVKYVAHSEFLYIQINRLHCNYGRWWLFII